MPWTAGSCGSGGGASIRHLSQVLYLLFGAERRRLGWDRRGWALIGCLAVLAACFLQPHAAPSDTSLLAGKAPDRAVGVSRAKVLTDGVAALAGDDWETDLTAQFDGAEASVTYDLGAVVPVRAIWFQADHNDDYRFMISDDGAVFEKLWDAPRVKDAGLWDRSIATLQGSGRYLRLEPMRGDGRYAVSEIAVWQDVPSAFPPEVARRRGAPLEVTVRTEVLIFATAALLCLLLAYRGAPWWWLGGCAALPLWAGVEAVQAIVQAWPVEQRQVSMVRAVCAAIAAFAVLREAFSPARFPPQRAIVATCLGTSALLAMLAFYNLGQPQFWDSERQMPTPVHLLDLRQYFGTVKYFDELGYRGLYDADVAAYIEDTPGATLDNMRDTPMRNLDTHRMSTVGEERAKIEAVKQQFSAERWQEYKKDARYFREVMGPREYLRYMFDFGGNATPVWISMASLLFAPFSANTTTFLLTGLLDPLLFLVTFGAIWRCFGFRTMALVMVVFGANDFIMYGTNWGGSTLRHDWLMYIGLGACALKRERWALGGFFLALSTMIRAFPAITLVSATLPALWWLYERHRAEGRWPTLSEIRSEQRPILRVLGGALVTAVLLVAVSAAQWSLPAWTDWLAKVAKLNADAHGNSVALRSLVAGWETGHAQLIRARWPLFVAATLFYVGMVVVLCRQKSLERAAVAGLILVPVLFNAANYYIHIVCFLPLLAVERRDQKGDVGAPLSAPDAWLWLVLLGLCVAQYWTVLVTDLPLHFQLATVLLFAAQTAILVLQVRADAREGRLAPLVRFFGALPGASPAAASPAAAGAISAVAVSPALASAVSSAPEPRLEHQAAPREQPSR
jgi:hypothetical protein